MLDQLFNIGVGLLLGAWIAFTIYIISLVVLGIRNGIRKPPDVGDTLVSTPPYDMATLEQETHDWRLTGKPGSVGAASVGLDAIDEYIGHH